ncbi:hypothetical protein F5Y15DRAFT_430240 [Xylariaceae sp. FL0016]|nr:hypothetical protein F5Y15DRAFT_430240 [Xylariaceae sp. FL0016]
MAFRHQFPKSGGFWHRFTNTFPEAPTEERLLYEILSPIYPEGIITDETGTRLHFTREIGSVETEVYEALDNASESLSGFVKELAASQELDLHKRIQVLNSYEEAMHQACFKVYKALDGDGLSLLDRTFWECFHHASGKVEDRAGQETDTA